VGNPLSQGFFTQVQARSPSAGMTTRTGNSPKAQGIPEEQGDKAEPSVPPSKRVPPSG
jgi:hypothetical protein